MQWEFLALLVPLAPFIVGGLWIWTSHQRRVLEHKAKVDAERAERAIAQNERLEQRVAVLERILTDRSARLGDEIEKLRDEPLN